MLHKSSIALLQNVLLIIWNIPSLVKAAAEKSNKKLQFLVFSAKKESKK